MREGRTQPFGGVSPWAIRSVFSILILVTSQPLWQAHATQAQSQNQDAIGGGLFVAGGFLYVAAWGYGVQVLDISTPAKPKWAGAWNQRGAPTGIYVSGNHAYVANRPHGLDVLDIHDPRNPVHLANLRTGGDAMGVYVKGRYAYLADAILVSGDKPYSYMPKRDKALRVIDIKDPRNPQLIESKLSSGDSRTAADVGELALVVNLDRMVYEMTPQTAPIPALIQMHVISGGMIGFDIIGNFAYSYWDGGLAIYDVRGPQLPKKISVFKTGYRIWDIRVAGKHAYLMDSGASIHVLDVSDPAKLHETTRFSCNRYVSRWMMARKPIAANASSAKPKMPPEVAISSIQPIKDAPPQLINPRSLENGAFTFILVGVPNASYVIQISSDLASWTTWSTNLLPTTGYTTIADPQATEYPQRYYRAVRQ